MFMESSAVHAQSLRELIVKHTEATLQFILQVYSPPASSLDHKIFIDYSENGEHENLKSTLEPFFWQHHYVYFVSYINSILL